MESLGDLLELVYGKAAPTFVQLTPKAKPQPKKPPVVLAVGSTDTLTAAVTAPSAPIAFGRRRGTVKKKVSEVLPLGATHVMSSTSNVASAPDRTNGTFPERFASRWSTKRATGRQRPRTYLSAANSTHESHVMSITSSVASASPPAPPASSFKGSRALTRGASRRTGPRRRGKGNNERYTKAKAAAAAAAAREAGGEDGGEGAESESGAEHGKAGGGAQ